MEKTKMNTLIKKPSIRSALLLVLSSPLATSFPVLAQTDSYPDRPITLVVPMAPGGPADTAARTVQVEMSKKLGQTIVIENRAGAAGSIAVTKVRRAAPDGYTLLIANASTHAIAPSIYEKLTYDPVGDFAPIGRIVVSPGILITSHKMAPDCKMQTFVDNLKNAPGKVAFGSAGTGTLSHLTGMRFQAATGTQMLHVPYKGLAPAINDLYSGQIDAVFDSVSSALSHVKDGKFCALAVQSEARLNDLPDVPTYTEAGLPDLNNPTWYGVVSPANTPPSVVTTLNAALNAALNDSNVKKTFERLGVFPAATTPQAYGEQIKQDISAWRETTERIGFEKIKQ
ncbi:tripartite tricarboxylate transporter substrate binding protein [Advenella sp. S44]|uniref:Bug family tripartite tricarboxylate transporter substrate binding protein n=1 Tax=Advenella sp. S44 TaxID=1982755 RepID=UPI001F5B7753|nr:tripartite tricarboxylate transporter substrate binding protein [Advenella sp. S44]